MSDGHDHTDNGGHDGHEHGVSPDAGHMLTDAAAIGLSLVALRLAQRPAKGVWTFGFKRGAGELGLISRAGAALRSRFGG